MNKMKNFLLLILSLMTGCEASSEVRGCKGGWVQFTCKYPNLGVFVYKEIEVVCPQKTEIVSDAKNVWVNKDRISLFHDTNNQNLRVLIRELAEEDFGKYQCKFFSNSKLDTKEVKQEDGKDICQRPFIQTAYRNAKTTITCDYPGNKYSSRVKFFCKVKGSTCEDILSTNSSPLTNGTFTLTNTNRGFSVSISNVSSQDDGVYWCGLKPKEGSYRAATRRIQLKVQDIKTFSRSPTVGQDLTYWCKYHNGAYIKNFICKGEDPSVCQRLVNTAQQNTRRFSMKDDTTKANITVTIRNMRLDDTGTYWCGAESTDPGRSDKFFNRLSLTVVTPTTNTSPAISTQSTSAPASSTQSTSAAAESQGDSHSVFTVIVCVAVMLLLFVIVLIIYKRFSQSKNPRNGAAAQNIREDYVYMELQERVQKPDVNVIYDNTNFPTNVSSSLIYSTINFPKSSDRTGGDTLTVKPSSPTCEYSIVKYSQSPTCSTVTQPSRPTEDPLYSTVNKQQKQQ
ncbi:polymeric immunoglobulin receptor-like isoform X3 [Mastacembelus armatus]|uniref:polymeric immunoglobulin receptor-like isoform X2 n=1 Tax=Mastacembelus armatus TaxID=205130 RepID=UPI0014368887|nr:polymeric immunoglobulin receptor-like isoform X2 [Mastacembelus armatus]XP_033181114.1 polymeric immunoglobulin receptor-like isoform X3 [Mastacembelus armatus]